MLQLLCTGTAPSPALTQGAGWTWVGGWASDFSFPTGWVPVYISPCDICLLLHLQATDDSGSAGLHYNPRFFPASALQLPIRPQSTFLSDHTQDAFTFACRMFSLWLALPWAERATQRPPFPAFSFPSRDLMPAHVLGFGEKTCA